ncbi:MAG: GTP cyclohydrolase I [Lachnospiraceae bacterium]|jgi:GTP cyclohydrolase I|nr:GTP cyclohydrolase I [Lachnospiraceae bacterium]MEE3461986.1 GTP cyclohydrolase I [Lachnospiraceae bacterium]
MDKNNIPDTGNTFSGLPVKHTIDTEAIKEHVRGILAALGDDPDREGLKETPDRVARMCAEIFKGMEYSNDEISQMFGKTFSEGFGVSAENTGITDSKNKADMGQNADSDDLEGINTAGNIVFVKDIDEFSYCEHHMALMYDMKISVAYIPKDKVIGLSKIARIADMVCRRLQLQERIGSDIADIISKVTGSDDVCVFIEACHSCMTARGIKKPGSRTSTCTLRGAFKEDTGRLMQLLAIMK